MCAFPCLGPRKVTGPCCLNSNMFESCAASWGTWFLFPWQHFLVTMGISHKGTCLVGAGTIHWEKSPSMFVLTLIILIWWLNLLHSGHKCLMVKQLKLDPKDQKVLWILIGIFWFLNLKLTIHFTSPSLLKALNSNIFWVSVSDKSSCQTEQLHLFWERCYQSSVSYMQNTTCTSIFISFWQII